MMIIGRFRAQFLAAFALGGILGAHPAASEEPKAATSGPGRANLAGFVVTPQVMRGGNQVFLIAPDSSWFAATSPGAAAVTLIETSKGIVLRSLIKPGLKTARLSISADSKTVFVRGEDGHTIAWDAATGQEVGNEPPAALHDVTQLSRYYNSKFPERNVTPEFLSRYRLLSHFPDLKDNDDIILNPRQEYAIIARIHASERTYQIWNLKAEKPEITFQIPRDPCGYEGFFTFDYDGKHIVIGNRIGGGCDHSSLDFAIFRIDHPGPSGSAEAHFVSDNCNVDDDQGFAITPSARLITKSQTMPDGQEFVA